MYMYMATDTDRFQYWTLLPILTLLLNFGGFHRTLQRVRLANRGCLLLRTPGPVPFGTCICSNVETILSWTCHVYGPFEFRTCIPRRFYFASNNFEWVQAMDWLRVFFQHSVLVYTSTWAQNHLFIWGTFRHNIKLSNQMFSFQMASRQH